MREPMRVALVCPYDLHAPGGVQVHVGGLADELRARGHEVAVLGPGGGGLGRPIRVAYGGTVAPIAPWPTGVARARRELERFAPSVVHVHEPFTPSSSMWATLASRAPVVATFHSWLDRSRLYEVAGPALRPIRRRLTATIAVSDAAARFVTRAVPGVEPVVIPNGLSVSRFAGAVERSWRPGRRIAWAHRLDPQKGFAVMVDAFARLAARRDDVWLSVAGDGADRVAVHAAPSAAQERIVMLGPLAHADMPSFLAGADVAVAAATGQESFGYSVVEAMAAGVPVVASDIDGYREVTTADVDALTVPPGDVSALAAAIDRVLDEPGLAPRLTEGGRRRAAAFDWSVVAERIGSVYRSAFDRAPPGPGYDRAPCQR